MTATLFCAFFLLGTALHDCDGMAVEGGESDTNWLDAMKPLVREEREITNATEEGYGDEWSESCYNIEQCQQRGESGRIIRNVGGFRLGEIYTDLESMCPSFMGCFDASCNQRYLKISSLHTDTMIDWMCRHKNEFKDTTCFTPIFTRTMSSCERSSFREGLTNEEEAVQNFRDCVYSAVNGLPGCSDGFFITFFNFVMAQLEKTRKMY